MNPVREKRMLIHRIATLTGLAVVTLFLAAPANALTMAECSTKYNAAKDAGTLGGQNWNQFRKAQCGTDATATDTTPAKADTTSAATADDAAPGLTAKECSAKYQDGAQERQVPDGDLEEVCRRDARQGSHAHLPRTVLCQQGRQ